MTKIDIISGFLGAGKTTFIKKMIDEAFTGEKIVLIENEFGEVGIDGGFLKDAGIQITEMNSGCICCSLVGDFGKNLNEVITKYHPDRILIEPSGVGKLSDVMKSVIDIEKEQDVKLNALVTVVNALKASKQMKAFGEFFNNQIEYATTVILSRSQNATPEQLEFCVNKIQELNPKAAIITTDWAKLSGEQILKVMEGQDNLEMKALAEAHHAKEEAEHEHEHHHHDHDHEDHEHHHDHDHHHDHEDHDHDHEEDEHDSDEVEYDEHIWTSPKNAVVLCRAVCDAICKADPANEDFYRANCDGYCAQIEALDARFADLCASAPRKLLVFADRFPMLYFCREFGLDYRAAFHGCSGDTEPSLATIKYLIDKVEDEDIPVVYTIDFGTKKVAAVVSECTGAAVDTLYSMQTVSRADFDAGETYLTLMERNYEALRKGLNE